jgi:hypothetical protein
LDRLRAASRTHLRGIEAHFLAVASPTDLAAVGRVLGEVASRACHGAGVQSDGCPPGSEGIRTSEEPSPA